MTGVIRCSLLLLVLTVATACGSDAEGDDPDAGTEGGDCTPLTLCPAGACASASDGCGGTLSCGGCGSGSSCGAMTANVCGACTAGGWCHEQPAGPRNGFFDVFGTSADDVWFAGDSGLIYQWSPAGWRDRSSVHEKGGPTKLWGTGPDRLWGVSAWGVWSWDGTRWSLVEERWTHLTGIWGTGGTDVWAVGAGGVILRFNGTSWSAIPSGTGETLTDVWASAANDAWVVGHNNTLLHWDGTAWSSVLASSGSVDFLQVQGIGPNQALVLDFSGAMLDWNGSTLGSYGGEQSGWARAFWAFGPNDVWTVGVRGTVERYTGTTWEDVPAGAFEELPGVWGSPNGDLWAASRTALAFRRRAP